ncbi:MAG: DUF58 domain-containing protein [Planctomycetota bacterium]|nr:DUF58 domain-containing protein [Planctomycetota bacterium]
MAKKRSLRLILRGLWRLASWPVRTLFRLTKDGVIFAALGLACATVTFFRTDELANIPLLICLVLASILFSGLLLGSWSLRHLGVHRRCTERTFAGEAVAVTLTLFNRARLPAGGVTLAESLRAAAKSKRPGGGTPSNESQRLTPSGFGTVRPGGGGAGSGQTFAVTVVGRGQERTRYTLVVRRRGIYQFGRTRLSTTFPFGFWNCSAERRDPGRLVVYPRLGEIEGTLFEELELAMQRVRRSRPSREEQEFRSLREYRHGDNPKWIHWRSSARMGRALVKEFEEPQTKRVLLLLDTNLQRLGTQRAPAFELAISFAGTVARELLRRACTVRCLALPPGERPLDVEVSKERRNLDTLLEALAGLEPDNGRNLADLKPYVSREQLRNTYILVLGLGSLRVRGDLGWLQSLDNVVKVLDVRGEEFRRIFRRGATGGHIRDELDEDLLLTLGDDELDELAQEELALVG